MKHKKNHHIIGTVPKFNRQIEGRCQINTLNTDICIRYALRQTIGKTNDLKVKQTA